MNAADCTVILNLASDMFAASPNRVFTREEVVSVLRALPDEIEYQQSVNAAMKMPAIGPPS